MSPRRSARGPLSAAGAAGLALLAQGAVACGPPVLQGSLTEVLNLRYQGTIARTDGTQASLRFTSPQGSGQNIVLEVAAQVSDLVMAPHAVIDLAETGPNGGQRGTVSRDVINDPWTTFPPILRGQLRYDALLVPGTSVTGFFAVTFVEGDTPASGRTVFSNFNAEVPQ